MSGAKDDGGPAFPCLPPVGPDGTSCSGYPYVSPGMTLRDYFIAHAPVEPEPWFKPQMPPCPQVPTYNASDWTEQERSDFSGYGDWLNLPKIESERVREAITAIEAARDAVDAWRCERDRARYVQWPAAWADAMLAERAKATGSQ